MVQGMSYWTYTDLFEEPGPPTASFQGGFGLMNPEAIRKPAWFAYKYLHALQGREIPTQDAHSLASVNQSGLVLLAWDWHQPEQKVSNRPFYSRLVESTPSAPLSARFAHVRPGKYHLRLYRTGYRHNDAYSAYIDMKAPKTLSATQVEELQTLTRDLPERDEVVTVPASGLLDVAAPMHTNDIVLVRLERVAR
jgi:xylan 1,4-beta-xylosidase